MPAARINAIQPRRQPTARDFLCLISIRIKPDLKGNMMFCNTNGTAVGPNGTLAGTNGASAGSNEALVDLNRVFVGEIGARTGERTIRSDGRSAGLRFAKTCRILLGVLLTFALAPVVRAQTKIMCLGDSITEGYAGWASYRYPLWFDLKAAGYSVDFVGPWIGYHTAGLPGAPNGLPDTVGGYPRYLSDFDRDHAGYAGWTTGQVLGQVPGLAAMYTPDVVLLLLGANDIRQQPLGIGNVDTAEANLRSIITQLRVAVPSVTVLLANNIPRADNASYTAYVQPLNARIAAIAASMNTPQSRIALVDQYSGFDLNSMMQLDLLHPNTAGEQRIADIWRQALSKVLPGAGPCDSVPSIIPSSSLLALYTFDDGTWEDVTASKNGLFNGFGNPQVVSAGYEGNGMLLDGQSYLRADVVIDPYRRPQLTVGAWVKLTSTSIGSTLFSHDNGDFDRTVLIDNRGGGEGWSLFRGPTSNAGNGTGVLGFVPGETGAWQLIAAVYDVATSRATLYVDGQIISGFAEQQYCAPTLLNSGYVTACGCGQNLFVGKEPYFRRNGTCGLLNSDNTLDGTVDNVFVMSESLSEARLDEIMAFGYHRIPTCATVFRSPACLTVCQSETSTFSVDAGGSGGVSYQWEIQASSPPNEEWRTLRDGPTVLACGAIVDAANSFSQAIDIVISRCADDPAQPQEYMLRTRVANACGSVNSNPATLTIRPANDPACGVSCDPDLNQDGNADATDVDYLINAIAGGQNPTGIDPDFNRDGNADASDIDALVNVVAGGGCP